MQRNMNMEMDMGLNTNGHACGQGYAGDMHMDKHMNTDMEWTCGNPIGQLVEVAVLQAPHCKV